MTCQREKSDLKERVGGRRRQEGDDTTCSIKRSERSKANPSQLNTGLMAVNEHRAEKIQIIGFYCLTVVKLLAWQRPGS